MSTVRFVATAFRWIIELLNILFAVFLVFAVLVYLFNREAIVGSAASFGYGSEFAMIMACLLVSVVYIVSMGFLCVILEIWESLKRIENGEEGWPRTETGTPTRKMDREPRI